MHTPTASESEWDELEREMRSYGRRLFTSPEVEMAAAKRRTPPDCARINRMLRSWLEETGGGGGGGGDEGGWQVHHSRATRRRRRRRQQQHGYAMVTEA